MPLFAKNRSLVGGHLAHFQREVLEHFGKRVSVIKKSKGLLKFGRRSDLSTTRSTVWGVNQDEVYATTNSIDTVSSSNAGDTQELVIEGHTVEGTGVDAKFTFVVQTVTLNGQNKVTLGTPLARVSRGYNNNSTDLAGDAYVYEDGAITGGVPNSADDIHLSVEAEFNQSFKAATTLSASDYYALTSFSCSVNKKTSASVDFVLEIRPVGKVFRTVFEISSSSSDGGTEIRFDPPLIVPANSDVRVRAISSANDTEVTASFEGYIAATY